MQPRGQNTSEKQQQQQRMDLPVELVVRIIEEATKSTRLIDLFKWRQVNKTTKLIAERTYFKKRHQYVTGNVEPNDPLIVSIIACRFDIVLPLNSRQIHEMRSLRCPPISLQHIITLLLVMFPEKTWQDYLKKVTYPNWIHVRSRLQRRETTQWLLRLSSQVCDNYLWDKQLFSSDFYIDHNTLSIVDRLMDSWNFCPPSDDCLSRAIYASFVAIWFTMLAGPSVNLEKIVYRYRLQFAIDE